MHVMVIPRDHYDVPRVPHAGVFERHQVAALRLAGVDVGVLSAGLITVRHLGRRFPYSAMSTVDGVVVYREPRRAYLPARWEQPLVSAKRNYRSMRPALKKYVNTQGLPDLVHAHNLATGGVLARFVHEEYGIPYVVTEHSSIFISDSQAVTNAQPAITAAAEEASRIIAVGNHLASNVRAILPPEAALRTVVVPNVVDPVLLQQPLAQRDAAPLTVGALGNLMPGKNYGLLLHAFALADLPREARLVIGGSGPEAETLVLLAQRLGIRDRVEFRGQLDRDAVWNLFRQSSIFAHPSNFESFGVVLIEAMAFGVPAVATASGGPDDIVTPDVGRLVPTHDVEKFAGALEDVHRQRDRFRAAEIRELCRARFGPETFARTMQGIYEEVLSEKPAPPGQGS